MALGTLRLRRLNSDTPNMQQVVGFISPSPGQHSWEERSQDDKQLGTLYMIGPAQESIQ